MAGKCNLGHYWTDNATYVNARGHCVPLYIPIILCKRLSESKSTTCFGLSLFCCHCWHTDSAWAGYRYPGPAPHFSNHRDQGYHYMPVTVSPGKYSAPLNHKLEGFIPLKSGKAQDAWPQGSYGNWHFHLDKGCWMYCHYLPWESWNLAFLHSILAIL